jgi:benzil reductase ((S)-benzoin forming)
LDSPNYHHLAIDLSNTDRISDIMERVNVVATRQPFDFICLLHNASAVEPLGPIENCPLPDIEAHMTVGLLAPMLLTSSFIERFAEETMRKKIAFISSGAAFSPMPGNSSYCSAKAGLHMFARCVAQEQKDRPHAFEVISIGPGMVDTPMQEAVRSKSSEEFARADYFKQAHEAGRLASPEAVADNIYRVLGETYEQGQYVELSEMD